MSAMQVEVLVILGFNEESDKALETAWRVAEKIRKEYGIWVIVKVDQLWIYDPIRLSELKVPQIYVNGKLFFVGKAPRDNDLVNAIMSMLWKSDLDALSIPTAVMKKEPVFSDAIPVSIIAEQQMVTA